MASFSIVRKWKSPIAIPSIWALLSGLFRHTASICYLCSTFALWFAFSKMGSQKVQALVFASGLWSRHKKDSNTFVDNTYITCDRLDLLTCSFIYQVSDRYDDECHRYLPAYSDRSAIEDTSRLYAGTWDMELAAASLVLLLSTALLRKRWCYTNKRRVCAYTCTAVFGHNIVRDRTIDIHVPF